MSFETVTGSLTKVLSKLQTDKAIKLGLVAAPKDATPEIQQLFGVAGQLIIALQASKATAARTELGIIDKIAKASVKPGASSKQTDAFKTKLLEIVIIPFYFSLLSSINQRCNSKESQTAQQTSLEQLRVWIKNNLALELPALTTFNPLESITLSQIEANTNPLIVESWHWASTSGAVHQKASGEKSRPHSALLTDAYSAASPRKAIAPSAAEIKSQPRKLLPKGQPQVKLQTSLKPAEIKTTPRSRLQEVIDGRTAPPTPRKRKTPSDNISPAMVTTMVSDFNHSITKPKPVTIPAPQDALLAIDFTALEKNTPAKMSQLVAQSWLDLITATTTGNTSAVCNYTGKIVNKQAQLLLTLVQYKEKHGSFPTRNVFIDADPNFIKALQQKQFDRLAPDAALELLMIKEYNKINEYNPDRKPINQDAINHFIESSGQPKNAKRHAEFQKTVADAYKYLQNPNTNITVITPSNSNNAEACLAQARAVLYPPPAATTKLKAFGF